MLKFSVIVPVYNAGEYLKVCIDSILDQTYKEFELILVDDGSTDNSPNICDEYAIKDSRIQVIHKKNEGVSMARQEAIVIAQGEYLVFVDADDSIIRECLEKIASHDGVDIIRYGLYTENSEGKIRVSLPYEREGYFEKKDIEEEIFPYLIQGICANYYTPSLCVHAFKRELFIRNMLRDKKITIGEDGACVIPCIYNSQSLYCIKECLYNYNYNNTSATKGSMVFSWSDPIDIVEHLATKIDFDRYDFEQQIYRMLVHKIFSVIVSQFNRKEKYYAIKKDILSYISKEPYRESIEKAHFSGSKKASAMMFALRHKQIWLIWLYSKIR